MAQERYSVCVSQVDPDFKEQPAQDKKIFLEETYNFEYVLLNVKYILSICFHCISTSSFQLCRLTQITNGPAAP